MAATELTAGRRTARRSVPAGTARAWLHAYGAVWTVTLAAAGLVAVAGPTLQDPTRRLLGLTLTPHQHPTPDAWHVLALTAHNIPIAAWPLLLGLAVVARSRRARAAGDVVVLVSMLANTVPIGAGLGAYGTALLPYIPQLPLEWAGLAAGYGSWLVQRRRALGTRELVAWLAVLSLLLLSAAVIETIAVPHR